MAELIEVTYHGAMISWAIHRDGRLVEYRGFCDTFDAVEQTLGRELAV